MKKKWGIATLIFVAVLVGLVTQLLRLSQITRTQDAVLVIAHHAGSILDRNPAATPEDVEREIVALSHASVIHVERDPQGRPLDAFGLPFRIQSVKMGSDLVTTVTSAGRDRRFDTPDDIQESSRITAKP